MGNDPIKNQAHETHEKDVSGNKAGDNNTETGKKTENNSSKRKDGAVLGELNGEATKETK